MIKKVETQEELILFNEFVNEIWREEGYEEEYADGSTECFMLLLNERVAKRITNA